LKIRILIIQEIDNIELQEFSSLSNLDGINIGRSSGQPSIAAVKCWSVGYSNITATQRRTRIEKAVPNIPENNANFRYITPISLALEDIDHLSVFIVI
jgi:hypothetical protein